jgi:hypothetical protein
MLIKFLARTRPRRGKPWSEVIRGKSEKNRKEGESERMRDEDF